MDRARHHVEDPHLVRRPRVPVAAGNTRDDGTGCAHGRTGPGYGDWDVQSVVDVLAG
jgi:hypothetical protein